jgi:hypothetical protein
MSVNTREKPFGCSQCLMSFVHSHLLKEHLRIHGGERRLCPECEKSLSSKCYCFIEHSSSPFENSCRGSEAIQLFPLSEVILFIWGPSETGEIAHRSKTLCLLSVCKAFHLVTLSEESYENAHTGETLILVKFACARSILEKRRPRWISNKTYRCDHCAKSFRDCANFAAAYESSYG